MGLGPSVVKMDLELFNKGYLKDTRSVIEMGSQGMHITQADLEELFLMAGLTGYKKEDFDVLGDWPNKSCSSRSFYNALGISEYACIDLNEGYGAIPLDLNYPLEDKSLYGKYDLVTDYGNNEHVFNTSQAYCTMHRLCKPGGIVAISQSVFLGKGYYAYDPSFLEGVAAANNYKILFSSFIVSARTPDGLSSPRQFHLPLSWELMDTFDLTKIGEFSVFMPCKNKQP